MPKQEPGSQAPEPVRKPVGQGQSSHLRPTRSHGSEQRHGHGQPGQAEAHGHEEGRARVLQGGEPSEQHIEEREGQQPQHEDGHDLPHQARLGHRRCSVAEQQRADGAAENEQDGGDRDDQGSN